MTTPPNDTPTPSPDEVRIGPEHQFKYWEDYAKKLWSELAEAKATIAGMEAADEWIERGTVTGVIATLRAQLATAEREREESRQLSCALTADLQDCQMMNEALLTALRALIPSAELHKRMADALAHIDHEASVMATANLNQARAALASAGQARKAEGRTDAEREATS